MESLVKKETNTKYYVGIIVIIVGILIYLVVNYVDFQEIGNKIKGINWVSNNVQLKDGQNIEVVNYGTSKIIVSISFLGFLIAAIWIMIKGLRGVPDL